MSLSCNSIEGIERFFEANCMIQSTAFLGVPTAPRYPDNIDIVSFVITSDCIYEDVTALVIGIAREMPGTHIEQGTVAKLLKAYKMADSGSLAYVSFFFSDNRYLWQRLSSIWLW